MRFIFYAILAYIAFQFIFNLLIPVFRASRKIKQGFREMHNRMQEQSQKQDHQGAAEKPASQPDHSKDYIDFEEIK